MNEPVTPPELLEAPDTDAERRRVLLVGLAGLATVAGLLVLLRVARARAGGQPAGPVVVDLEHLPPELAATLEHIAANLGQRIEPIAQRVTELGAELAALKVTVATVTPPVVLERDAEPEPPAPAAAVSANGDLPAPAAAGDAAEELEELAHRDA